MNKGNGIISSSDLEEYSSKYRDPVIGTYKDYKIMSMGPPSSGGVLLINMLNMLEEFPLDTMGWNSSDYFHLLTEVERRAYADRSVHLGDPDFWEVPTQMLISKNYAKSRIRNIDLNKATPSSEISASTINQYESTETTHYSVIDQWGNAVSVTTTINLNYGNGHVVEGAGFFLNNEMKLSITGLMCIPPIDEDPKFYFNKLRLLASENNITELSIGMSEDYESALQFKPKYIRLGTILFGKRN